MSMLSNPFDTEGDGQKNILEAAKFTEHYQRYIVCSKPYVLEL